MHLRKSNSDYTKLLMTSLYYYTVINFVIHTNTLRTITIGGKIWWWTVEGTLEKYK